MKKLILITLLFACFGCKNTSEVKTDTTTYYLIRHAEKDKSDPSNKNPNLIVNGLKRAKKWSNHFKNIDFNAIYSTNYNRTIETALPTAMDQELEITPYNPQTLDLKLFLKETKGQNILIVGHSNTTPAFVNKIIGEEKYQSIDETINSKLFIVSINNDKITSKVIDVN